MKKTLDYIRKAVAVVLFAVAAPFALLVAALYYLEELIAPKG